MEGFVPVNPVYHMTNSLDSNIRNILLILDFSRKRLIFAGFLQRKIVQLNRKAMKKGLHPETYRLVAFKDMSNETVFITRSCAETKETLMVDGVEYPVVKVEISNTSHPFYTGKVKLVDTAGRVDKFYQRYKNRQK